MKSTPTSAADIDALLPQTQCRQCGYAGCLPYAAAIVEGAAINRCPPGGPRLIAALALLLERPAAPLDPECGTEKPRTLAAIDEAACIGCALCLEACPVDAIVGTARHMHTVLADLCTGCELCLPPCPVDCILLTAHPVTEISAEFAELSKRRHESRNARLERDRMDNAHRKSVKSAGRSGESPEARKRRIVNRAVARARQRAGANSKAAG